MGKLDINTPRGRTAARDQRVACEIVFGPRIFDFVPTSDTGAARVDGFLLKDNVVQLCLEIKSRECSVEHMMKVFKGEWLLTYRKLKEIQILCDILHIPCYGLCYCKGSGQVLVLKLVDEDGKPVCKYRVEKTTTSATCNGGMMEDDNAFIDVTKAKIYG